VLWLMWAVAPYFCVCMVLGFELRAYTLSHSTSSFSCDAFFLR
jgi:hypothetical protein